MNFIVGLMFVVVFIHESNSLDLPENFKKCHRTDAKCLDVAVPEAVMSMINGLPSFKLGPLEPLDVSSVLIGSTGGSVSIEQNYTNIKVYGLTQGFKIQHEPFDDKSTMLRSVAYNTQVSFVGKYSMKGRVLILPITGTGLANITMQGLKTKSTIYFDRYEKDGENYLRVKKYECKFTPKNVIFDFSNLFNGDARLSTQMNKFLNEHWETVFRETQAPFEKTFGLIFAKLANEIFSRVPENKLFLN